MAGTPGPYTIEGKMYIIFGSEFVNGLALFCRDLFEMGWSEPGQLFKLRRKMMNTTESCLIRDFCK
jgi:hypothetical protein